jgi:hypothetical protein
MPLSKSSTSTTGAQKRAGEDTTLEEPSRRRPLPQYLKTKAYSHVQFPDQDYIPGLSAHERVELILWQIYNQHHWRLEDLLLHIVTAESSPYAPTKDRRIRSLSKAVLGQETVIRAIIYSVPSEQPLILMDIVAERFIKEIDQLSTTVPGLGKFNINTSSKDLDLPRMTTKTRETAPSFWQFLNRLATTRQHRGQNHQTTKTFGGEFVTICAIIAHYRASQTSNNFQILLGMHLHSMGVKRRVISLLHGLGLTMSYTTTIEYVDQVATLAQVSNTHSRIICTKDLIILFTKNSLASTTDTCTDISA